MSDVPLYGLDSLTCAGFQRKKRRNAALEATQGQLDGLCSQLPYKCHLEEVASVGN